MTVVETGKPVEATGPTRQLPSELSPARLKQCPAWCRTHAEHPGAGISHCRLIEKVTVDRATGQSLEIAVVQEEDEEGLRTEPSIYIGVHTDRGHKIVRHTAESAYTLSQVVDAASRNGALTSLVHLLDDAVMPCLPVAPKKDNMAWLQRLPIALRGAANTIMGCRRTPCPPWCVERHTVHWDTFHAAGSRSVPLSRYPYWCGDECVAATVSVGLCQDQDDRAPIIVLTTHDDDEEELAIEEAEDLARDLLHMAATARGEA